jgi:hypothetical protein
MITGKPDVKAPPQDKASGNLSEATAAIENAP